MWSTVVTAPCSEVGPLRIRGEKCLLRRPAWRDNRRCQARHAKDESAWVSITANRCYTPPPAPFCCYALRVISWTGVLRDLGPFFMDEPRHLDCLEVLLGGKLKKCLLLKARQSLRHVPDPKTLYQAPGFFSKVLTVSH